MDGKLTICLLFYGDYPALAYRCLEPLWARLTTGREHLLDVRIGLNEVSPATRSVVDWFVTNAVTHYQLPVITFDCPQNACKYPLMRRMLLDDPIPPAEWVMWFDDDSYLHGEPDWWQRLFRSAAHADMLGKLYSQGMVGRQWDWIAKQTWFNPAVGPPPPGRRYRKPSFRFCTGGWWMIRSRILQQHNWPTPELRHRGGDALLGELCRHQGLRLLNFEEGVRINADKDGRHSKSPRRGVDELQLGHLSGQELPNHNFVCTRTALGEYCGRKENESDDGGPAGTT